jgi:hypothetical protein
MAEDVRPASQTVDIGLFIGASCMDAPFQFIIGLRWRVGGVQERP